MLTAFAGWNEALLGMLGNVQHVFKWGIYDRDPLTQWTRGRVTLLGDAAHPMMPTLAQGASITLEDAYTFARNVARYANDPAAALKAYKVRAHRPRTPRATPGARPVQQQPQTTGAAADQPRLDSQHDATAEPMALAG